MVGTVEYSRALAQARLIRRYKRFLADVRLPGDRRETVYCPNTGAMHGCNREGARVWLSQSDNLRRKYPLTLEIVESDTGALVGVNTGRTNCIVREALEAGRIREFARPTSITPEFWIAAHRSRVDFRLNFGRGERECLLEVKSVTARDEAGMGFFPDAVSERAVRHLDMLAAESAGGRRTVLFYCVQRVDVTAVRPAREIHPGYAEAVSRALGAGVEVIAYGCRVSPGGISIAGPVEVAANVV